MTATIPAEPRSESRLQWMLYGPTGLRAGWRLLIFVAIIAALIGATILPLRHLLRSMSREDGFGVVLTVRIVAVIIASWIMARIEGRRIADYGFPWRLMFRSQFWIGAIAGFAALSFLLGALYLAGAFRLGGFALHGSDLVKFGIIYAVGFVLVGIREEFESRGYLLFTLSSGLGFWPAAILSSLLFGASHRGNMGESWVGVASAGLAGFVFCVILRKSGNLWMAIGAHAGWDWGESFFYGVADSGMTSPHHLFNSQSSGPAWLSGGSVGPEGSWFCLLLFAFLCYAIVTLARKNRFPDPAALAITSRLTARPGYVSPIPIQPVSLEVNERELESPETERRG